MVADHAERRLVGGILAAGEYGAGRPTLRAALDAGLSGRAFYRRSLGAIFSLLIDMDARGLSLDPVSVASEITTALEHQIGPLAELDERVVDGELLVGRVAELAAEPGAYITTVGRMAWIVVEAAARRDAEERVA